MDRSQQPQGINAVKLHNENIMNTLKTITR